MLIKWSVQDGQLYWPVIAMCSAACYEAATAIELPGGGADAAKTATAWLALAWHVVLIVVSSVLVTISTMDATTTHDECDSTVSPLVLLSIILAMATAITYSATHHFLG